MYLTCRLEESHLRGFILDFRNLKVDPNFKKCMQYVIGCGFEKLLLGSVMQLVNHIDT